MIRTHFNVRISMLDVAYTGANGIVPVSSGTDAMTPNIPLLLSLFRGPKTVLGPSVSHGRGSLDEVVTRQRLIQGNIYPSIYSPDTYILVAALGPWNRVSRLGHTVFRSRLTGYCVRQLTKKGETCLFFPLYRNDAFYDIGSTFRLTLVLNNRAP